jgi:hypothetical protein
LHIAGLGSDDEVRLVDHLFERQGYNPLIRPVRNLTEKVEVGLNLALIQLINVVRIIFLLSIRLRKQYYVKTENVVYERTKCRLNPGKPEGNRNDSLVFFPSNFRTLMNKNFDGINKFRMCKLNE